MVPPKLRPGAPGLSCHCGHSLLGSLQVRARPGPGGDYGHRAGSRKKMGTTSKTLLSIVWRRHELLGPQQCGHRAGSRKKMGTTVDRKSLLCGLRVVVKTTQK